MGPTPELAAFFRRINGNLRPVGLEEGGWRFKAIFEEGAPPKVAALAELENLHRPGDTFQVSRSAVIWFGDVVGAAFDAVLMIEEHDAMERFRLAGQRVLDSHRPRTRPIAAFREK